LRLSNFILEVYLRLCDSEGNKSFFFQAFHFQFRLVFLFLVLFVLSLFLQLVVLFLKVPFFVLVAVELDVNEVSLPILFEVEAFNDMLNALIQFNCV
jgi:hypothetical protein